MEDKEVKILKEFYEIDPDAPYYPTGVTLLDEVAGGGLGMGLPGGKFINVAGAEGGGKCLKTGYILDTNGFSRIEDIGKDYQYGYTPYKNTLALDSENKVEADYFYRERVDRTVKVTTKNVFSVEGTENHLIGIWTKNGIEMRHLRDVKVGDYVVTAGGTEMYGDYQKMPVVDVSSSSQTIPYDLPDYVDENFAKFLGYFVADGNITKSYICVSSNKKYVRDFLAEYFTSFGFHVTENNRIQVSSLQLVALMQELLGNVETYTARNKYVPECILKSPKSVQASFLQGLIDCDSNIVQRTEDFVDIEYSTASERLMNEVRLMLLNMGIHISVSAQHGANIGDKYYDHTYYRVRIPSSVIPKYKSVIGSIKYDLPDIGRQDTWNRTNDFPYLPEIVTTCVAHIREQVNWKKNGMSDVGRMVKADLTNITPTYHKLSEFLDKYRDLSEYFPNEYPYELLKEWNDTHYVFDEITSVEVIDEVTDVFDFHVPNGHLFWANGIINHNTFLAWHIIAANVYYWKKRGVNFKWMYDDAEHGSTLDVYSLYGIEDYEDHIVSSSTVEEYHLNMNKFLDTIEEGERGIYILDSFDPLKTENDVSEVNKDLDKMADGKFEKRGSYDMAKQKYMSSRFFPQITTKLANKHAIGIVISQVRYNVSGMGAQFTISGGKALDHGYNTRLMLTKQKAIQITSEGETLDIGAGVKIKLLKNKCPRPNRECQLDIYFTKGVDDVGACVDYLYQLKTATGQTSKRASIEWDDQTFKTREAFIKYIYDNKLVKELRKRTIERWERLEEVAKEKASSSIPEQQFDWD